MSRRSIRSQVAVAMVVMLATPNAVEAQSDTITPPRRLFTWRDGVLAGAFAGVTVAVAVRLW